MPPVGPKAPSPRELNLHPDHSREKSSLGAYRGGGTEQIKKKKNDLQQDSWGRLSAEQTPKNTKLPTSKGKV